MDGYEPEVGQGRPYELAGIRRTVEPLHEAGHLFWRQGWLRAFEVGRVEDFALDDAGLHHVGGESFEGGMLPLVQFQGLHAVQEISLEVANPAEQGSESTVIPGEARPVRQLVQVLALNVCGYRYEVSYGRWPLQRVPELPPFILPC